ncbi:MAG: endonuclease MutS2, partial [Bacillota bacterium]
EQSIEQNLSTFSSHMNKIRTFLNKADDESLVLLDELGAGTDPKEGAALGISLLEKLKLKNAVTVATTHYSQLKSFAYSTEGVQNASVEFDIETLQPTYKLIMGVPGGSNAFDIALKLGIPEEIISRAKELIDSQDLEVEDIIKDLNNQRKKYRELKNENQKKNREIKRLKNEYEEKLKLLQNKKSEIIKNAEIEAEKIIKDAKKQSKSIIQDLKNKDFVSKPEIDRKGSEVNQKFKEMEEDFNYNQEEIEYGNGEKVQKGDLVRVRSVGQKGEILEINEDKKEAVIQAGIMKVTADLDDLVKVNMPDNSKKKLIKKYQLSKSESVSNSIDIRGERYTEAQRELDKYIDDAVLAGYKEIEIIHGKGSGALREAVAEILEQNPNVSNFRLGRQKEGGTGVTIANIT